MPDALYVGLQDEDRIVVYAVNGDTGELTRQSNVPAAGAPSVMAVSLDRRVLYVGSRGVPAVAAFRIDATTGALTRLGSVATEHAPTFLALDRSGKYLLSAYYQGGYAAVHAIAADGTVGASVLDRKETGPGAHAIQTDPSNRFAFVPHIASQNDNVLEPPKNIPGPNFIAQFRFDAATGRLGENSPFRLEPGERIGPRHYCFHPALDIAYFSDEQGCSVSSYRLDRNGGTLSAVQRVSTLPAGDAVRNTCSQIHLTPDGRFLYVGNRGHNSIAGFAVDAATGTLSPIGHVATEAVPSAFCLDSAGRFLFAAGTASGRLAAYRVNRETGALTPLATVAAGHRPAAMLSARLGS
jgi:6-phosphogluconolactonase